MKKQTKVIVVIIAVIIVIGTLILIEHNKKPEKYSYNEYERMSPEERVEFQQEFDSFEDFDKWVRENIEE